MKFIENMITIQRGMIMCECGHLERDHSMFETSCLKMKHPKERRINPATDKYEIYQTHYQCACKKFIPIKEKCRKEVFIL